MNRVITTIATTAIIAVSALLFLTAAAPAAPRWPSASLEYYEDAQKQIKIIGEQFSIAFAAADKPDSTETISETIDAIGTAVDVINDLTPPVPLLAFHQQNKYAAAMCQRAVIYAQSADFEGMAAMAVVPIYAQFGTECLRALNEALVEGARYASTVGGFPEEK